MERLFDWIAYRPPAGAFGVILWILLLPLYLISLLYTLVVKIRLLSYRTGLLRSGEVGCRVVSVGNITVGGVGKTPVVEFIARRLKERGLGVAVLSRGYKGKKRSDVNVVCDGENILLGPDEAGDEPYMLARRLEGIPVLVGTDRSKLGMYAVDRYRVDAAILDDGYQHLGLKRDLDILVVDGERGFGNGLLFPRGPLREPLSEIRRAKIILVNKVSSRTPEIVNRIKAIHPGPSLFQSTYRAVRLVSLWSGSEEDLKRLAGTKVVALAAIAHPASFTNLLTSLGADVTREVSFEDHHHYTVEEIESVMEEAGTAGAELIVTTEKDAVKLERLAPVTGTPLYFLEIGLNLAGDEEKFIDAVLEGSGLYAD